MSTIRPAPIRLPGRRMLAAAGEVRSGGGNLLLDRERVHLVLMVLGALLFLLFSASFYQDLARQSAMGDAGVVEEFADTRF